MAVIIMNRFVIKPVLVPPTKHNQLVGDSVPAPSNAPDHQHNWQMDQAPFGPTNTPLPDQAQCYATFAIDNLNSELEV